MRMNTRRDGIDRRRLTGALAGLALALGAPVVLQHDADRAHAGEVELIRFTGGGLNGGGVVTTGDGSQAHVAVMGTRLTAEGREPVILGSFRWQAPEMLIESRVVQNYGPLPDNPLGRFLTGRATVNGAGDRVFRLEVVTTGVPGQRGDRFRLSLDAEPAAPAWRAEGALDAGNVQLFTFSFDA